MYADKLDKPTNDAKGCTIYVHYKPGFWDARDLLECWLEEAGHDDADRDGRGASDC